MGSIKEATLILMVRFQEKYLACIA